MDMVLGAAFAIVLGILASHPYLVYQKNAAEKVRVAATASEMRQIDTAAKAYIQANYSAVQANSTPNNPAVITVPMLISTGYLPNGVGQLNPFGQQWQVEVLQPSPGKLQALVISSGGAAIPEKLAPAIAAETGQEGGFVPYPNQYGTLNSNVAEGAYGHWQVPLAGYGNVGAGRLASLLAFNNGALENDYLYRVAVPGQPQLNTMQTNIDMAKNSVGNAYSYSVEGGGELDDDQGGSLELGGNNSTAGSGEPYIDFHLGGQGVQDFNTRLQNTAPDTLSLQGINGDGSLNVQGRIGAAGEPANSGYPAGWSGGIHSWDIYANGSIGVGSNGSLGGWLQNNGYGGVSDTFKVGSRLELGTAFGGANPGWGCGPNGEIAANANGSGQLMACVDGQWKAAGASGFTQSYQMGIGNGAWYQNTGGTPEFISSNCNNTPYSSGYVENVTIIVRNPSGQQVSSSRGQVQEGGSDANFAAAPSASAIIPPGYIFDVVGSNMACSLSVTR